MRKRILIWLAPLVCSLALAQPVPPNQTYTFTPITTNQITLPVFEVNAAPASGATLALVGNPGPRTDYYWIVANYLVGSASPAGPFPITNAPNVRSGSNHVTINPIFSGPGVLNYDTLRTTTPIEPTGVCNCAVATGVSPGTVTNDQSGTLNSYTVAPFNIATLAITLTNEVQSSGVSNLILRQSGVLVCNLSEGCGGGSGDITGSGSSPFFPIFTAPTTIANSNLQAVTSPNNGVQYSVGGGQYFQLDAAHLSWNVDDAITIANTYTPGSDDDGYGIAVVGGGSGGESCAGQAQLIGGSNSGSSDGATITAGKGCANGIGAIGGDVTLAAGSTTAGNSGGSVYLIPGTGAGGNGNVYLATSATQIVAQGKLDTVAPGAIAGFNLAPGTGPPTTASNGDLWTTATGIFAEINGLTESLLFGSNVADVSISVSSATQGANSCSSAASVTMTNLTTSDVVSVGFSSSPDALTGWGSSGGMVFRAWPQSANTLNWSVCNQTASSITYSAITFNVGAR